MPEANPYKRISTPAIRYEGKVQGWFCFRLKFAKQDGLDCLLFKGEIASLLLREGVAHEIGNAIPGVAIPYENPMNADFFLLLKEDGWELFLDNFVVENLNKVLVA